MMATQPILCQHADCKKVAAWVAPNYYTKGGRAAKQFRTVDRRLCEDHGKEAAGSNPFVGWGPLR